MRDLSTLPPDLPEPADDGACAHLEGAALPSLALTATSGGAVVFAYPHVGSVTALDVALARAMGRRAGGSR